MEYSGAKTTTFTATDAAGNKYKWSFWRDPRADNKKGLWFLKDPDGYVRSLENTWIDSVPRIRTILENHDMKADIS